MQMAEVQFEFKVVNPIPVTGYLKVVYDKTENIEIEAAEDVRVRCLPNSAGITSCGCGDTGISATCTILVYDNPDNPGTEGIIEVKNLFASAFKKQGDHVVFSLSGFCPQDKSTVNFKVLTFWYDEIDDYAIDSYESYSLTLTDHLPQKRLNLKVNQATNGQVNTL